MLVSFIMTKREGKGKNLKVKFAPRDGRIRRAGIGKVRHFEIPKIIFLK